MENLFSRDLIFFEAWLFLAARARLRAIDLALEAPLHWRISLRASEFDALLKSLDRTRYVALAEMSSSFAEDARVAFTLFGRIHDE